MTTKSSLASYYRNKSRFFYKSLRLPVDYKKQIQSAAKKWGLSDNEFVLTCIEWGLENDTPPKGNPDP